MPAVIVIIPFKCVPIAVPAKAAAKSGTNSRMAASARSS